VKWTSLTLRFLCEIAAIVAFVWWGWPVIGIVVGAGVIAFWWIFVAPKAKRRLSDPIRLLSELAIFACATAAFFDVGQDVIAVVFAVLAGGTALLVRRWPEPVG
jgi:Protein of unknown function (DUF2568)